MRQTIKLSVICEPDDDELFKFEIILSNGDTSGRLEFWSYGDDFKKFGEKLADFPKGSKDVVTYQAGGENITREPSWAYYLLLSVFCYDPSGKSAIHVIMDNYLDSADHSRSEFYIKSEPAILNKLGQELMNWNPENKKHWEWTVN